MKKFFMYKHCHGTPVLSGDINQKTSFDLQFRLATLATFPQMSSLVSITLLKHVTNRRS